MPDFRVLGNDWKRVCGCENLYYRKEGVVAVIFSKDGKYGWFAGIIDKKTDTDVLLRPIRKEACFDREIEAAFDALRGWRKLKGRKKS